MAKSFVELKGSAPWLTVLIAGAPADLYREISARLRSRRAIYAKYHWEYHSNDFQGVIPKDVHFVILITDFIGHPDETAVKNACRAAQIPWIRTSSPWSTMSQTLSIHGINMDKTQGDAITLFSTLSKTKQDEMLGLAVKEPEPPKFTLDPPKPSEATATREILVVKEALQVTLDKIRELPLGALREIIRAKLATEGLENITISVGSKTFYAE